MEKLKFTKFLKSLSNSVNSTTCIKHDLNKLESILDSEFLYDDQLKIVKNKVNILQNELANHSFYKSLKEMDEKKIISFFSNDDNLIDFECIDIYFNRFFSDGNITNSYLNPIKKILNSKKHPINQKIYILNRLKEVNSQSKLILTVYNSNISRFLDISIDNWYDNYDHSLFYKSIVFEINHIFKNDPSKINMYLDILKKIYLAYLSYPFLNIKPTDALKKLIYFLESDVKKVESDYLSNEDKIFLKVLYTNILV